jgi:hypothetical protein
VVTASSDKTARLWDAAIMTDKDTREDIALLAELAQATGGVTWENCRAGRESQIGDSRIGHSIAGEDRCEIPGVIF